MKHSYKVTIISASGQKYSFGWECPASLIMKDKEAIDILLAKGRICVSESKAGKVYVPAHAISDIKITEQKQKI